MPKKPKFKPVITRIKLNPEQAVLYCACYNLGYEGLTDSVTFSDICFNRVAGFACSKQGSTTQS